ncbi:hypothetical protein Bbelb_270050 [Branchiostoma belcheri]|nr:hypothetical protein Bbelb_270050 [Branchiostoma belcheri]
MVWHGSVVESGAQSVHIWPGVGINVRVLAANFKRTVNPLLGLGQYMGKSARDSHTSPPYQPTARRQGHQERTVRNGRPPTRHGHESVRNTPLPTHPSVQQGQENGTSDGPGIQGQQSSDAVRETRSPIAPRGRPFHQETQPTAPKPPHPGPPPFPPSSGRPPFLPSPGRPPFLPSPGRPPFLPNQAPGPWGCPPGSFSHPPVPWGTPTTNSSPNTPPRINSSPWTWHPSMFWPPMIDMCDVGQHKLSTLRHVGDRGRVGWHHGTAGDRVADQGMTLQRVRPLASGNSPLPPDPLPSNGTGKDHLFEHDAGTCARTCSNRWPALPEGGTTTVRYDTILLVLD